MRQESELGFNQQKVDVDLKRCENGILELDVKIGKQRRIIPVFSCREDSHKEEIARRFARYETAVAFGVGLYGVSCLVEDPRKGQNTESWKSFYEAKQGREVTSRIPIYIPPKYLYRVMDMGIVHQDFRRYFDSRESREGLFRQAVACHFILPIPDDADYIHPVFITTPEDWEKSNKPEDQWLQYSTVSDFWWHDPDWEDISNIIELFNPDALPGISSFNPHLKLPAFNLNGVINFIQTEGICPFDFAVQDPIGEPVGVNSSHLQIKPAFVGEPAEWVVYREGARSVEGFLRAIDSSFPARIVEGATLADRGYPADVNLDPLIEEVRDRTEQDYRARHPKRNLLQRIAA